MFKPLLNDTVLRSFMICACLLASTSELAAQVITPLAPPANVAAVAGNRSVNLTWTTVRGASGYRVKRGTTNGGPYAVVGTPGAGSYQDNAVTNGTTYYYVVSAVRVVSESANSAQVSATPVAPATIPAAPAGLSATAGDKQVMLSWSASGGATSYRVKRATGSGGPFAQVAASASTSHVDMGLTNGVTYYYVVTAVNAAGESASSAQAAATPAAGSTGEIPLSGLHVSGNRILNGQNQAVALRGVNKSGTEYMCIGGPQVFDGPSDAASVNVLKSWAINIVRLPLNEDCWLGINGVAVGGTAYRNAVVNYVNLLAAANIATIIDLQWAAPGTTVSNQLTPMPDADHAPAFWSSVADTFKPSSMVIFDLFNEPYPDNNQDSPAAWACLKNGGTCPGVGYQAAGMQSLVNAIRATGSTNIVMVPGVQFTNVLTQWLANKPADPTGNLAASWHSYQDQICNNQSCWDNVIKPVMQSVPLIAGEIGEGDCQHVYVDPLMAYLDANGGHYLAWAWNTYDCNSFPALISSYDGTPTGFGVGVRDHFLGKAGQAAASPATVPYFSNTYPFGIAVGSNTGYTAGDGTVYHPDVANAAMTLSMQFFTPFTTGDAISGTPDPLLYQRGRQGGYGTWTINLPNGNYRVTLGMAPNSSFDAGEFGQDQSLQGQKAGTCIWSQYSGTNLSPASGTSCPQSPTMPAPAADVAQTVTYAVSVFNQQLSIQPAASFGGGRTTILNTIKVDRAP